MRHRWDFAALILVAAGCLAWSCHAAADEFRAVVVTDQESAALRAAKTRADEAQAAFVALREATEQKYRERLGSRFWSGDARLYDWSTDFRVLAEPRWSPQFPPSNPQWLQPRPLYQPGWWGSVTIPTVGAFPPMSLWQSPAVRDRLVFGSGDRYLGLGSDTDTNIGPNAKTVSIFGDLPPINGSVRTEWDGVIHGSVSEPITPGVIPGAVAQ